MQQLGEERKISWHDFLKGLTLNLRYHCVCVMLTLLFMEKLKLIVRIFSPEENLLWLDSVYQNLLAKSMLQNF